VGALSRGRPPRTDAGSHGPARALPGGQAVPLRRPSTAETIEYGEQGHIVWALKTLIDGYSDKLGGVRPDKSGAALGSHRFDVVYFM
jgi:hypothetical protein